MGNRGSSSWHDSHDDAGMRRAGERGGLYYL